VRFSDLRSRVRINPVKPEDVAMRKRRRGLVALVTAAALVLSLLSLTSGWRLLDLRIYDYLSTLVLPELPQGGPIIVAIDEPSLSEIAQQWPWPRSLHAQLVEALREAGASAIGLDIIFAEPSTPQADAHLAAAMRPDTVLAGDYTVLTTPQADQEIRVEPLAELLAGGATTGITSIGLDGDGMMRRVPRYPDGFARRLADAAGQAADLPEGERLSDGFLLPGARSGQLPARRFLPRAAGHRRPQPAEHADRRRGRSRGRRLCDVPHGAEQPPGAWR
jgi:adenylate cyclase